MGRLKKILELNPFYLFLLPLFFVLHGVTENYPLIPFTDALKLTAIYLGASLLIAILFWIFYRNISKAFLLAFLVMAYQFAFGSIQDFLKDSFDNTFIYRYRFILPFSILIFIFTAIWIKRRKKTLLQLSLYLNILFITLLLIDTASLTVKASARKEPVQSSIKELTPCDSCTKPDIYLLVADEYAGASTLKELFQFDNSEFENDLKKRGFHVINNSISNYNFSPFAIASMLKMDYLEKLVGSNTSSNDMNICYSTIKENRTFDFFKHSGYKIYNYSIFDLPGQPTVAKSSLLHGKTKPITSQTFTYRILKQLGYHLAKDLRLKFAIEGIIYKELKANEKIYTLTQKTAREKSQGPKFVYTHLLMPHYPYYFDSKGNATPINKLTESYNLNEKAYTEYLLYTNKKLLTLIDHIKASSSEPPIIILIGDHGFRQYRQKVEQKYNFLNFNAVFFPDSNYTGFYKGMSNVNQFRVILNSQFGQRLSILKDSMSYLRP